MKLLVFVAYSLAADYCHWNANCSTAEEGWLMSLFYFVGFQLMRVQHMLLFQLMELQLKDMLLNATGAKNRQI